MIEKHEKERRENDIKRFVRIAFFASATFPSKPNRLEELLSKFNLLAGWKEKGMRSKKRKGRRRNERKTWGNET